MRVLYQAELPGTHQCMAWWMSSVVRWGPVDELKQQRWLATALLDIDPWPIANFYLPNLSNLVED